MSSSDAPLALARASQRAVTAVVPAFRARSGSSLVRAVLAGVVLCAALSGCGVFCGGAGGSGGALAAGCSTGMRF
jgi:hypothetical protein